MPAVTPRTYILIADPDREPQDSPTPGADPSAPQLWVARTVRECQQLVSTPDARIIAAFVCPSLGHPAWLSVARDIHAYHPGIPLYLTCGTPPAMTEDELRELGVHKTLIKPVTYDQMLAEVRPAAGPAAADEPQPAQSAEAHTATEAEVAYISVKAASLLANIALNFSIYIKLGSDHYTRLWSAGDLVDKEQFERQTHAGVKDYYIKKEDQRAFLENYDKLVTSLMDNPETPLTVKVSELRSAGENTINLLKREGISAENIQYAVEYVGTTMKAIGAMAKGRADLRTLFLDTRVQDHAVATAMLGSLMLFNLGMSEGDLFGKLGIALMLHDIALWNQPAILQEEEPSLMNPQQLAKYLAHPVEGARILAGMRDFPAAFLGGIAEHHVRLNGTGFPAKEAPIKPNRIAELIGICGDLSHQIKLHGPDNKAAIFARVRDGAPASYTPPIVEAFERAFLK